MFRKLLVLAIGITIGAGGAQAATAIPALHTTPAIGAEVTLAGHRHANGYYSRGYSRSHRYQRPRYRGYGYVRPRHGYRDGYGRGYPAYGRGYPAYGRGYPAYGRGNAYPHDNSRGPRQDYLRNRYGK